MSTFSLQSMRDYLGQSITSLNLNKLRGLLAEVDLRNYLGSLGYAERVSPGGWVARSDGAGNFGHRTIVLFPETINPGEKYLAGRALPPSPTGLHSVGGTFHQSGIAAYFCSASISIANDPDSVQWASIQLGLPSAQQYQSLGSSIQNFRVRVKKHSFLRYHTDTSSIPDLAVPEEFSKEHLRITFQNQFFSEISDVDGIFYGTQIAYPLEIKEKTCAPDRKFGDYFGLDLGPFVKLAFYAAKRGNLHSIFIVREIDSVEDRNLVGWWFITFERLAQFASWNPRRGGTSMLGGASTVVPVPKAEFQSLNAGTLAAL